MSFVDNIRKEIKSSYIIGSFHLDGNSGYFDDLRGAAGERIEDFYGNPIDQKIYISQTDLIPDEFYQFDWDVKGTSELDYSFICKGNIKPIDKDRMLQVRLDEKMEQRGTIRKDANQNQEMINREVTGAPHTYIYELLQNSNDYPVKDSNNNKIPVEVKFILTDHYLFFIHSGAPFNLRNIAAICTVNEGEKRDNTETIGYKGMGFKSVFVNNDYVFLSSGGWNLRFDEKEINKPGDYKRNWQYMPIPTNLSELDEEILKIKDSLSSNMNVFFALRHIRNARENEPNLRKVFSDNQILVFIPYVDHVEVIDNGKLVYDVYKDRDKWLIKDNITIPVDSTYKYILDTSIKEGNKIPEKFKKIDKISIAFAIQKVGNQLLPMQDTKIYNYLPTEQSIELPFLINADFVPDASRKSIPDLQWNLNLLKDSGREFAKWWTSLMNEGYDLNSVFNIMPEIKDNDNKYRASFMAGFFEQVSEIPCIPVLDDNGCTLFSLKEIIYDDIEFIAREMPVMDDKDFYEFIDVLDIENKENMMLPHPEVRLNKKLKSLLDYFKDTEIGHVLQLDDLISFAGDQAFDEWILKEFDNAINFYTYLFDSNQLNDFIKQEDRIFVTEDGKVTSPDKIYFNIDEWIDDIYMFKDLLPRLNCKIREELSACFFSIENKFKKFDEVNFAKEISQEFKEKNYSDRIKCLQDSVRLLDFFAKIELKSNYNLDIPDTYPLFLKDNRVINGNNDVYIENELALELSNYIWIKKDWINFISPLYYKDNNNLRSFLNNHGILPLSEKNTWENIFSVKERIDIINENTKGRQYNIELFKFLFKIRQSIDSFLLRKEFYIWATDDKIEELVPLSLRIFQDNDDRRNLLNESWLPNEVCWVMLPDYFSYDNEELIEEEKLYYSNKCGIHDFTFKLFLRDCLKDNWKHIIDNVNEPNKSYDLLDFLFHNRENIDLSTLDFDKIPVLLEGHELLTNIYNDNFIIYQCSSDIDSLLNESWFPAGDIDVIDQSYKTLFDGSERIDFFEKLHIETFELNDYIENNILNNIVDYTSFEESDNPLEANISFHKFFAKPTLRLSDNDYDILKNTPVFTISPIDKNEDIESGLCDTCSGFFLPSDKLEKLVELDIVPNSILRTIRPEYFEGNMEQMTVYFRDKLGNRQLQDKDIVDHLLEHKEEIIPFIKEKRRNIRFWQWAAQSSTNYEERKAFRIFPIIDETGNYKLPKELYASALFSKDNEAEQVIRRFIPDAKFVSDDYAKIETQDESINWLELFKNIKIGLTAEYVLLNKVLPNLNLYNNTKDDVILALAGIYDSIKIKWSKNQEKIENFFSSLNLKCNDEKYRNINDVIISGEYTGIISGKYPDINLPNQVSDDYLNDVRDNSTLKANLINLFRFLQDKSNVTFITSSQDLAERKVKHFLSHQKEYSATNAHYRIIGELAEDIEAKAPWIESTLKGISFLLYSNDDRLIDMSTGKMYLGSIYEPTCDFQANGVTELYVNDEYHRYGTLSSIKSFLTKQGKVRWGFHGETEMKFLQQPQFSNYFWNIFLPEQLHSKSSKEHFDKILTTENLEKYNCIPTGGGMRKPSNVYNPSNSDLVRMVTKLGKQDKYLPSVKVPFEYSSGFAGKLSPTDCIDFLKLNDDVLQADRKKVCEWLTQLPDNVLQSNFKNIALSFKENARWKNGAKIWVPLKDLYVLEKNKESKHIIDHFGGSEWVCAVSSMPDSNMDQKKLCSLFGLTILKKDDFDYKAKGEIIEDVEEIHEIQKRLLYLTYKENSTGNWEEKYLKLIEKLNKAKIECCDEIIFFYSGNESLSTSLSFIDNGEVGFSYKKGRKAQMFLNILDWVIDTFGLSDIDISVLQELFLEPFSEYVKKHDGGSLHQDVIKYLSKVDKEKIGIDIIEEIPDKMEEPYVSSAKVPESSSREVQTGEEQHEGSEGEQLKQSDFDERKEQNKVSINPISDSSRNSDTNNDSEKYREKDYDKQTQDQSQSSEPQKTEVDIKNEQSQTFEQRSMKRWEARRDTKVTPPTSNQPLHNEKEEILDIEDKPNESANYGKVYDSESKGPSLKEKQKRIEGDYIPINNSEVNKVTKLFREEADKQSRRCKLNNIEKYTLEWFNYLIDLQLETVNDTKGKNRSLDLYDWVLMDSTTNLYRIISPSSFIPSNLTEVTDVNVYMINNGKKSLLSAEILESDESGIDLICHQNIGSPHATRWIRIEYRNSAGFSYAQAERFSQLNNTFNLATRLDQNLPRDIEFIYGPPGTGKTSELVKRISSAIIGNDNFNILVVTPTNRAADEIAERLITCPHKSKYLSRYGVTESRDLINNYPYVLKNRNSMDLNLTSKNIMVTTIARYPYDSVLPDNTPIFDLKWDLIIIDEASMIDIVPITLLLINNKAKKYIIAGDPKQIRPVKPSFDYPDEHMYNIYDMVNINSFKEAHERKDITILDVQHRSVAEIGDLVSKFFYDGILKNDNNKANAKPLHIEGIKIEPINVIGYEVVPMSHLYDFKSVDNSSVHVYSAIFAYEFASYIAINIKNLILKEGPYTIGIVSPYKKQADAIQEMLSNRKIDNENCVIKCGTVHKFQGGECDIMLVVMNYPDTNASPNANINNLNIMNVAISRAKDYVFFLCPELNDNYKSNYLMNNELFSYLPIEFNFIHAHDIEKLMYGDEIFIAKNSSLKSHLPVNVSIPTGKRYEVRISDTALDIQIND